MEGGWGAVHGAGRLLSLSAAAAAAALTKQDNNHTNTRSKGIRQEGVCVGGGGGGSPALIIKRVRDHGSPNVLHIFGFPPAYFFLLQRCQRFSRKSSDLISRVFLLLTWSSRVWNKFWDLKFNGNSTQLNWNKETERRIIIKSSTFLERMRALFQLEQSGCSVDLNSLQVDRLDWRRPLLFWIYFCLRWWRWEEGGRDAGGQPGHHDADDHRGRLLRLQPHDHCRGDGLLAVLPRDVPLQDVQRQRNHPQERGGADPLRPVAHLLHRG